MRNLLIAVTFLFSVQAFSMIGKMVHPANLPFACKISYAENPNETCTGTLTKEGVVTAAHCLSGLEDFSKEISVTCGGQKKVINEVLVNPRYQDDMLYDKFANDDMAILKIAGASTSADLPKTEARGPIGSAMFEEDVLSDGGECMTFGFGISGTDWNDTTLNAGPLTDDMGVFNRIQIIEGGFIQIAQRQLTTPTQIKEWFAVKGESLSDYILKNIKILNKYGLVDSLMTHGDSGGSMLCRMNSKDQWTVVGINHGMRFDSTADTIYAPKEAAATAAPPMLSKKKDATSETTITIMSWAPANIGQVTQSIWTKSADGI